MTEQERRLVEALIFELNGRIGSRFGYSSARVYGTYEMLVRVGLLPLKPPLTTMPPKSDVSDTPHVSSAAANQRKSVIGVILRELDRQFDQEPTGLPYIGMIADDGFMKLDGVFNIHMLADALITANTPRAEG